jgi:hypothetical protein
VTSRKHQFLQGRKKLELKTGSSGIFWEKIIGKNTRGLVPEHSRIAAKRRSDAVNSPVRMGWVSLLRVATEGAANSGSANRPRHSKPKRKNCANSSLV